MVKKLKWIGIIIIIGISIFYGVKSLDSQKYYHRVIESGYVSDFDTMIIDTYDEYKKETFFDRIKMLFTKIFKKYWLYIEN